LLECRIAGEWVAAKHVLTLGQLTLVISEATGMLSVLQCAPPSVVVAARPEKPTAVHVLKDGQLIARNGPLLLPLWGSELRSKLSAHVAPASLVR
jgi:hypothetical protein